MNWAMLEAAGTFGILLVSVVGWIRSDGKKTQILDGLQSVQRDHEARIRTGEKEIAELQGWRESFAGRHSR